MNSPLINVTRFNSRAWFLAVPVLMLLSGCKNEREAWPTVVACHVRPSPVAAGETALVELSLKNPDSSVAYRWRSSAGAFRPEETQNPSSAFIAPAVPGKVRVTVFFVRNGTVCQAHEDLIPVGANAGASSVPPSIVPTEITTPNIEITEIPPSEAGGPDSRVAIAGRVTGIDPSKVRVVIYARTDDWWVQPVEAQPLTFIAADGTWHEFIHGGAEYAVLLVVPSFKPSPRTPVLPRRDSNSSVLASARALGRGTAPPSRSRPL